MEHKTKNVQSHQGAKLVFDRERKSLREISLLELKPLFFRKVLFSIHNCGWDVRKEFHNNPRTNPNINSLYCGCWNTRIAKTWWHCLLAPSKPRTNCGCRCVSWQNGRLCRSGDLPLVNVEKWALPPVETHFLNNYLYWPWKRHWGYFRWRTLFPVEKHRKKGWGAALTGIESGLHARRPSALATRPQHSQSTKTQEFGLSLAAEGPKLPWALPCKLDTTGWGVGNGVTRTQLSVQGIATV